MFSECKARIDVDFVKTFYLEKHCVVTLSRPEKRNAFNPQMIEELTSTFASLSAQSELRAIILKGDGKSFCAGADLDWMKSMVEYSEAENIADSNRLFDMFYTLHECAIPIISIVHGHVMGGGTGIVAASDIVIAEASTQFAFSEVKLGLAPATISPFILSRINANDAHRFLLTGERFSASKAREMGLVTEAVEGEEIEDLQNYFLKNFYENGPQAVNATKGLLNIFEAGILETKDYTSRVIAERRVSEEGQQGLRGFIENRSVPWKTKYEVDPK
ncbi:MAG: enoyl-CoA hydratase-related protein [Bdellovibrionales bacterium]